MYSSIYWRVVLLTVTLFTEQQCLYMRVTEIMSHCDVAWLVTGLQRIGDNRIERVRVRIDNRMTPGDSLVSLLHATFA